MENLKVELNKIKIKEILVVKIKEIKKVDKYFDLAGELKQKKTLWNMRVTVIPIVVGALGTILKGLEKEKRDWKWEELKP